MDDSYTYDDVKVVDLGDYRQKKKTAQKTYHYRQKKLLGGRVQVCRVLIQRYYRVKQPEDMTEKDFINNCERVLDTLLARHSYDIEYIIDKWRENAPPFKEYSSICSRCGYRSPFCGFQWNKVCSHITDKEDYALIQDNTAPEIVDPTQQEV